MDSFAKRLATFTSWPHHGQHVPRYMAAAGFYQDHKWARDAATCFHCDLTLADWAVGQDPATKHVECQPSCTWIVGKTMNTQEKREDTFQNWPWDGALSHMMVAAAGFYQSDRTNHAVTCHSCQLTLQPGELLSDPLQAHISSLSAWRCTFVRRNLSSVDVKEEATDALRRGPCRGPVQTGAALVGPFPPSPPASPHASDNACTRCGKDFATKRELFSHLREVHRINKCRKCGKRFANGDRLADHLLQDHAVPKVTKITKMGGRKVQLTGKPVKGRRIGPRNRGARARAIGKNWPFIFDHDNNDEIKIKQEPET